jgi:ElaB/YqjD/DUF883 family membrane-anchored ribosome-binding protein
MSNEDSLQNKANEVKRTVKNAAGDVGDSAKDFAATAKEKISSAGEAVADQASGLLGAARERAGEFYEHARDQAEDLYESAKVRVRTLGDDGIEFVRDNPVKTVLTALAAGFILGFAVRHH